MCICYYHVEVGESGHACPKYRSGLDRPHPQEVRELQREYSDAFVVITTGNRAADVPGHDSYETSSKQTGACRPQLLGEQVRRYRRQPASNKRQTTDVKTLGDGKRRNTNLNTGARKTQMSRM